MSPVRQSNPRSVIFAIATFAIGAVLVVGLFVFAVGRASESGKVEVKLGSDTFDAGSSTARAESIAKDGPFLFSDLAGGQRDIFLQHEGTDPSNGWIAFDARKPGQPRNCQLVWIREASGFRDSCDGSIVSADGAGLPHYTVEVNDKGNVIVTLNADKPKPTSTTESPPEPSTTSTIKITGAK